MSTAVCGPAIPAFLLELQFSSVSEDSVTFLWQGQLTLCHHAIHHFSDHSTAGTSMLRRMPLAQEFLKTYCVSLALQGKSVWGCISRIA